MKNLTELEISLISKIIESKELDQVELTTAMELLSNLSNEYYDAMSDILADSENEDYQTTLRKMLLNLIYVNSKEGQLIFHATMSLEQFVEAGYCKKGTFGVSINPKGNKHPKGFFIHWKDSEGVNFSGAVSTKILSADDITDPVLSIVSTPNKEDMHVLFHNKIELEDNSIFNF